MQAQSFFIVCGSLSRLRVDKFVSAHVDSAKPMYPELRSDLCRVNTGEGASTCSTSGAPCCYIQGTVGLQAARARAAKETWASHKPR